MSDEEEKKVTEGDEAQADKDAADEGDGEVYNQANDVLEEGNESQFKCFNPQMKSGHIEYMCAGTDSQGAWEGERRFNQFFKLVEKLEQRWPGIPIPTLPPKKAIGNKDLKFINERRFYLDRFLKKLSAFPFIINSEEFLVFSRPQGDIEKLLAKLPNLTPMQIVDRMREALSIEEHLYDPIQMDSFDQQCHEFSHFHKQVIPVLKGLQKDVSTYMNATSQGIQDYKQFLSMLEKYEGLNFSTYVDNDESRLVFGNGDGGKDLKKQVSKLSDNLKNPYFNIYHWVKGEIFDIDSIMAAVSIKDKIEKTRLAKEKTKKSTQENLDNVTTGRKTVKTLFKNIDDTGKMVSKIENVSASIAFDSCDSDRQGDRGARGAEEDIERVPGPGRDPEVQDPEAGHLRKHITAI